MRFENALYLGLMQPGDIAQAKYHFKNMTFRRIKNLFKLWAGYHFSRITHRPHQWAMPFSISIEPTTACNLGCPECPSGLKQFTRPTGNLKPELLGTILDELGDYLQYITFYFQGEPFIHPNMIGLIKEASRRKIFSVTSTNAHFITEKTAASIDRRDA